MEKQEVFGFIITAVSDINFMLLMIIIILVAACFFGRYVDISRKMIIATIGILVLQIVFMFGGDFLLLKLNPELYHTMENLDASQAVPLQDEGYEGYAAFVSIFQTVLNISVFVYAFVFYLVCYKEKKFLRALESTIVLLLLSQYEGMIIQFFLLYIKGGDPDYLRSLYATVGGPDVMWFNSMYTVLSITTNIILFLIVYFGYYKKKKVYVVRVRDRVLFVVWLVAFYIIPSIPMGVYELDLRYKVISAIFAFLIPVLGILAPVLIVMNAADKSLKEKNEYQETYLNAELEYIERYKNAQTETRAFRHDIINNLSLTSMMLEEGKVEDANQHLKELLGNVRALSPSIITGDEMLDCIVAMKADKMKELDISFTTDGVVDGGLHMKPMDICSIFANALDNAIEAARKVEKEPWVDLKIKRTEKFFVLKVSNAAEGKVDVEKLFMSNGYTSKSDKEHHGFGLRNIRQAVEEYDGLVKADSDEGTFGLSIMIPRNAS